MHAGEVHGVGGGDGVEVGFPHVLDERFEGDGLLLGVDGGDAGAGDAAVGDEDVDGRGALRFDGRDGGGEGVLGGYVALDGVDCFGGDGIGDGFEGGEAAAEDEDCFCAVEGEGAGHVGPEAWGGLD